MDGGEIVCLLPENDADLAEIRRLEEAGLLDTNEGFHDDGD